MQVNGNVVVERHNRPNVISLVALRAYFLNDGQYADPLYISGVTVFDASSNYDPSTVLNSDRLIASASNVSSLIRMHFANSSVDITDSSFDSSNYTPGSTASGIYRLGTGQYVCILDGGNSLSGNYTFHGQNTRIANTASTIGEYIDIWTIQLAGASKPQIVLNEFSLYNDTFFSLTQPLLLQTYNKLITKRVKLNSKVALKISTDLTVQNKDIDNSIKNIFKDSLVTSASMEIKKINEDQNLPSRVTVSGFTDTSGLIAISSDNTISFLWDTSQLSLHSELLSGNFGSLAGPYTIQVKYNILNETIYSPLFTIVVE